MNAPPTVIEPFCGAGGMALGLARAGLRCLWASDADPRAVATLAAAGWPAEVGFADACLVPQLAPHVVVDVVAGGPPCQPFSIAGKAQGGQDSRDGFPADWPWQGPKTSVYRQVGNACPPAMAEAVGRAVAAVLAPTPHGIARTDEGGPEQSPLLDGDK